MSETLAEYHARTKGRKITCNWTNDGEGNWETGCGNLFVIIDGTPTQNGMAYCCYCGKRLKEHPQT